MKAYIEITLIDNPKLPLFQLWSQLYTRLHHMLVADKDQYNSVNIGISFPEYHFNPEKDIGFLGTKLRLFSAASNLQKLLLPEVLAAIKNDICITPIRPVPDHLQGYAIYQRRQYKSNPERLARRSLKRGNFTNYETALQSYKHSMQKSSLPFIRLKSASTGQDFSLYINKTVVEKAISGSFTTYALSKGGTVPEF